MVWGSFLIAIAAAALKTPTRNGYNAQGVNLYFHSFSRHTPTLSGVAARQAVPSTRPSFPAPREQAQRCSSKRRIAGLRVNPKKKKNC